MRIGAEGWQPATIFVAMGLQTPRLALRRFRPEEDLDGFAAVCADAEVMRFIGTGRTLTRSETRGLLATIERHWDDHGFGLWAVDVDGQVAGFCGLAVPAFLPQVLPAVECGWRLGRPWWGRGLATEAGEAALAWGRAELGLRSVVSIIAAGNARSARVAVKLGMRRGRDRLHPGTGRRVHVYERALP
jgi:RimJ/RimL family protein N-acetyltransferase